MTCRERLQQEHPSAVGDQFIGGCNACPHDYGYAGRPLYCSDTATHCEMCWDRECGPCTTAAAPEACDNPMTVEQKRAAIRDFCRNHTCDNCPMSGNAFCSVDNFNTASSDVIDAWYEHFFGDGSAKADAGQDTNVPTTRATILDAAKAIVCDGRPQEYGGPEDSFGRIAELWTAYTKCDLDAHDVAMMMALLKIARTKGGKYNKDNYVDLAGYAACAGEIGGKGCVE